VLHPKKTIVQLEGKNSILIDQKRLHKLKNNSIRQIEIQREIQKNQDEIMLQRLVEQVLEARLAYRNALFAVKGVEMAKTKAQESLDLAQMKRARQDSASGEGVKREEDKLDLSVFEDRLNETQLQFKEKERLRLEAYEKLQKALSLLKDTQLKIGQS